MGADLTLRQSDAFDEVLELGKLHGGQSESAANLLHHTLVFGRVGGSVFPEYFRVVSMFTLQVADDAAGDKLQVTLAVCEADEGQP